MLNISYVTVTQGNEGGSLQGVNDVMVRETTAGTVVYVLNAAATSALESYLLNADGSLTVIDTQSVGAFTQPGVLRTLTELDIRGYDFVLCTGLGYGGVGLYRLGAGGTIDSPYRLDGELLPNDLGLVEAVPDGNGGAFLIGAGDGDLGLSTWHIDNMGVVSRLAIGQTGESGSGLRALGLTAQGIVVAADASDNSIVTYRVESSGAVTEIARLGAADGIGINDPSVLEIVEIGGQSFALLGASGSGSISVFAIDETGALTNTDHVLDSLDTRFADASVMDSITLNGRTFVAVAGSDDGVTLLELMPNGHLIFLEQLVDTDQTTLDNISSLTFVETGGTLTLLVTSGSEAGLTAIGVATGALGLLVEADPNGGLTTGREGADLVFGGAGDDFLIGEDGSDVLFDGAGIDTMRGGAGADLFVLAADGSNDVIADFEFGVDRLDLSQWPFLRNLSQLDVTFLSNGVVLRFGDEELRILSATGTAPHVTALELLDLIGLDRVLADWFVEIEPLPPEPPSEPPPVDPPPVEPPPQTATRILGDAGNNFLVGTYRPEEILGSGGQDTLDGGAGHDTLFGEDGNDSLIGYAGHDLLYGGDGNDIIRAGIGLDTLYGGTGRDTLDGMGGNDTIYGENDDDLLIGYAGHDALYGGAGDDDLRGGKGYDTLYGGIGDDTLDGMGDHDTLYGDGGNDLLIGYAGNDVIYGGSGNDTVYGGVGWDTIHGEDGADLINAMNGHDVITGGSGNDTIFGNAGPDLIHGDEGDDLLRGGIDLDTIHGGAGNDVILGERGYDLLFGDAGDDLLGGSTGRDTLDGGAGNDTLVGGLHPDQFIFNGGHDVIRDFEDNVDTLAIDLTLLLSSGLSPATLLDHVQETDEGLLITFGAQDSLLVIGLDAASQLVNDLIYV